MILALESSCDESAIAIFDPARGMACEWIHSQIALHAEHGGVVPDIATREHLRHFGPLLKKARESEAWERVTTVAVTRGPGLAACLAVGIAAAKAVALARHLPVVGVNHLRAHAWSPFIPLHASSPAGFETDLENFLPHLGLLVSGGNTLLFSIDRERRIRRISGTRDDAAGEALDKGAKLLGIGYPGGPAVEKLAVGGDKAAFDFPRGIGKRSDLDFSFSGLKTSLRYRIQGMALADVRSQMGDLCASYQEAVVDALTSKTAEALARGSYRSVGLSGGVANNTVLRARMLETAGEAGARFLAAEPRHTGDNAGMIAFDAWIDSSDCARFPGNQIRVDPGAQL